MADEIIESHQPLAAQPLPVPEPSELPIPPLVLPENPPPVEQTPLPATAEGQTFVHFRDGAREVVETIVFVTVLWLMWKVFAFEPFVIPTGSMAETLWGYQKVVECPQCGYNFPVNCSDEMERKPPMPTTSGTCPNCRYHVVFDKEGLQPTCNSGDRVLVAKFLYDLPLFNLSKPEPFDVVVFKFPGSTPDYSDGPQKNGAPVNYIKRLIGLPGQTIAIHQGDLYVAEGLDAIHESAPMDPGAALRKRMHRDHPKAVEIFTAGQGPFKILRKKPRHILALARLVYDNDYPARDQEPRWTAVNGGAWQADTPPARRFVHAARPGDLVWLHYRHLPRGMSKPMLITDFLGYNGELAQSWVGDLILECEVTVEQPEGELVLELCRGTDRFRAGWDCGTGVCTLTRLTGLREEKLDSKPTALRKGTYRLRFANVDQRLTVWVDGALPFGEGVVYEPFGERGPTSIDLQPASMGARGGALSVQKIKLWRDTYYTSGEGGGGVSLDKPEDWSDPAKWEDLRKLPVRTLYVQPGHYLCLGDNSTRSSDSRAWGLVPESLMLGRALLVFYPFARAGLIR